MVRVSIQLASLLVAMAVFAPVASAKWELAPELKLEAGTDSNIQLSENREDSVNIANAELRTTIRSRGRTYKTDLLGAVKRTVFGNTDIEDETSYLLSIDAERTFQRTALGFKLEHRDDSLLRPSQTDLIVVQPILDTDVGLVENRVERQTTKVIPSVAFNISRKWIAEFSVEGERYRYDRRGEATGLKDGKLVTYGGNLQYAIGKTTFVGGFVNKRDYSADRADDAELRDYGLNWARSIGETTDLDFAVGRREVERESGDDSSGLLVQAGVTKRWATSSWRFQMERSDFPNSFGEIAEITRVFTSYDKRISRKWRSISRLNASRIDGPDSPLFEDLDYAEFEQQVRFGLSRSTDLQVSVRYRWVDRDNSGQAADGLSVLLGVIYHLAPSR